MLHPPYQVLLGLVLALTVHEPMHLLAARLLGLRAGLYTYRRGIWVAIYCRVEFRDPAKYAIVALAPLAAAIALLALNMWWALPVYLSTMMQDFYAAGWAIKKLLEKMVKRKKKRL